jgi:hypothetical protein
MKGINYKRKRVGGSSFLIRELVREIVALLISLVMEDEVQMRNTKQISTAHCGEKARVLLFLFRHLNMIGRMGPKNWGAVHKTAPHS